MTMGKTTAKLLIAFEAGRLSVDMLIAATGFSRSTIRNELYLMRGQGLVERYGESNKDCSFGLTALGRQALPTAKRRGDKPVVTRPVRAGGGGADVDVADKLMSQWLVRAW